MNSITIYDPSAHDTLGAYRGAGRNIQALKVALPDEARFVTDLAHVDPQDTLLIPLWRPFEKPLLTKRIAQKQLLWLYDVIPLKYPDHFPLGIRGRWRLFQNTRALEVYDLILTISQHAKQDIHDHLGIPLSKIHVLPNTSSPIYFERGRAGTTRAELVRRYGLPKGDYALYVGDTNWNKNLPHLAQGVIEAGVTCVCVGKAFELINELRQLPHAQQESRIATLSHVEHTSFREFIRLVLHDEHFIFPGFVADEDLPSLYKHAQCTVFVSYDEGYGLIFLEAATQKCPSVLADVEVFHETAQQSALFADPDDPSAIARQIRVLFDDRKRARHLGQDAYHRAKANSPAEFRKSLLQSLA